MEKETEVNRLMVVHNITHAQAKDVLECRLAYETRRDEKKNKKENK